MQLQFVSITSLDEKFSKKWAYVICHILLLASMILDNQIGFATIFATIHRWLNDM
jgi:hypothetical protein